jgi:protein-S-isoprenylcysteine O-methyltransferase Ste14
LLLLGAVIHLIARLQFRSFRMAWGLESGRLITSGVYHFVRHPQNLGWGLLLTGIALLGSSGVALMLTGLYVLTSIIWLPVEEAALERRFGSTYSQYRARTPAFIPFTRRHP